eukprot:scaffold129326_cov63-Attheya_sp.AAC.1
MTPSPPAAGDHPSLSKSKKLFRFRLEARNAGVGAFHVITISDESNNNNNNNNNDSQVAEPSETATVENTVSRVEVSDNETIVNQHEVSDGERIEIEEARVERAATSTTSIRVRDAYLESIKRKSCVCLSTLFVSAAIVFTIFYNRGDDGGNREFSRGTAGSPTA